MELPSVTKIAAHVGFSYTCSKYVKRDPAQVPMELTFEAFYKSLLTETCSEQ